MANIIARIEKFLIRVIIAVRKVLRRVEGRLDEMRPHPILGMFVVLFGVIILIAGVAMLVLPGPGTITCATGIAAITIGANIMRGHYGPDRVERERKKKHERLERKRAKQADRHARAEKKQQHKGYADAKKAECREALLTAGRADGHA